MAEDPDITEKFDLTAEFSPGTTVVESSAGTGKTYVIVGLATRLVAEGTEISQLLIITFSRAAAAELRDRTHRRFIEVAAALTQIAATNPDERLAIDNDPLVNFLACADDELLNNRITRLQRAIADFDAAMIATTHRFCASMIEYLGIAGEFDPRTDVVEDLSGTIEEIAEDLYLNQFAGQHYPVISLKQAKTVARQSIFQRQAELETVFADHEAPAQLVNFASLARKAMVARKKRFHIRDYDDLQQIVFDALAHADTADYAQSRLRERFTTVLVDEFQDTDPIQWGIIKKAFVGHSRLILVGDPKQAIYGFRGAEVTSYLAAVHEAEEKKRLLVNYRSEPTVVAAQQLLFRGASLGDSEIVVQQIDSGVKNNKFPGIVPLKLRFFGRSGLGPRLKSGFPSVGPIRQAVAFDVAEQIKMQLAAGIDAGEIAVLVRTSAHKDIIQAALDRSHISSVFVGGSSVFATDAATDWLRIIEAINQPHRIGLIKVASLTPLIGYGIVEIDSGGEDLLSHLTIGFRELAEIFLHNGFAAVANNIIDRFSVFSRLLSTYNGERLVTDYLHLSQLLHRAATENGLGVTGLLRWLRQRITAPPASVSADQSRRLDRDAHAVQILTIHNAKGLQYPIVYIPYGWDDSSQSTPDTLVYHKNHKRILDVGGISAEGYATRLLLSDQESAGEELRLLYVAITRAQSQINLWWAPSYRTAGSPLHRLIFDRTLGSERALKVPVPEDNKVADFLVQWAAQAPELVTVTPVVAASSVNIEVAKQAAAPEQLAVAMFSRVIDYHWRRTSYSGIVAHVDHAPVEIDTLIMTDEESIPELVPMNSGFIEKVSAPSLFNGLPQGAAFGTLVHEIFQHVDTQALDLKAEIFRCAQFSAQKYLSTIDLTTLTEAIYQVMLTPLGLGKDGKLSLSLIKSEDSLAELDFEFPLDPFANGKITVASIAELMVRELDSDDPFIDYPAQLMAIPPMILRGFLTGSIDSVIRFANGEGEMEYLIIDYKTNRIALGELTVETFNSTAMSTEMIRSHYPLQALLYCVALHRFLTWKLTDYEPNRHLAGVQYHFVRGMVGENTPMGCGVFNWQPPVSLVIALSDLFAG